MICRVSSSWPRPKPSTPALLEITVRSLTPLSRSAAISASGMPHRPKPPTAINWPSRTMPFSAAAALGKIFSCRGPSAAKAAVSQPRSVLRNALSSRYVELINPAPERRMTSATCHRPRRPARHPAARWSRRGWPSWTCSCMQAQPRRGGAGAAGGAAACARRRRAVRPDDDGRGRHRDDPGRLHPPRRVQADDHGAAADQLPAPGRRRQRQRARGGARAAHGPQAGLRRDPDRSTPRGELAAHATTTYALL